MEKSKDFGGNNNNVAIGGDDKVGRYFRWDIAMGDGLGHCDYLKVQSKLNDEEYECFMFSIEEKASGCYLTVSTGAINRIFLDKEIPKEMFENSLAGAIKSALNWGDIAHKFIK